ncbi:hypothetical protein SNEBB_001036 [Seison nebaliae]|nr:hypothetical protein SNEBB_001036 [Seison nebaliae]
MIGGTNSIVIKNQSDYPATQLSASNYQTASTIVGGASTIDNRTQLTADDMRRLHVNPADGRIEVFTKNFGEDGQIRNITSTHHSSSTSYGGANGMSVEGGNLEMGRTIHSGNIATDLAANAGIRYGNNSMVTTENYSSSDQRLVEEALRNQGKIQQNTEHHVITNQNVDLNNYKINYDPNPQVINKIANDQVTYQQNVAIRYLQPPTPPPPAPIIVKEIRAPRAPTPPPLVIRQRAERQATPPPMVVRENPPAPPPMLEPKIVHKEIAAPPPPPRRVIIERLPPLPPKPRSLIVERWLPYRKQQRRVIYQKAKEEIRKPQARNMIIQWQRPSVQLQKNVRNLGVVKVNPKSYVQKYSGQLTNITHIDTALKKFGLNVNSEQLQAPAHVLAELRHAAERVGASEQLMSENFSSYHYNDPSYHSTTTTSYETKGMSSKDLKKYLKNFNGTTTMYSGNDSGFVSTANGSNMNTQMNVGYSGNQNSSFTTRTGQIVTGDYGDITFVNSPDVYEKIMSELDTTVPNSEIITSTTKRIVNDSRGRSGYQQFHQ